MDEKQCARLVLRQLRAPAALDDLEGLAAKIAANLFAVVKMEHDLGWTPPLPRDTFDRSKGGA